ncbi:MAG: hypothetical protein J6Y07_03475 [Alphaproteobacteria bacterium]|nr:hypothetical protein [Alphaproteobacteria bacterium]
MKTKIKKLSIGFAAAVLSANAMAATAPSAEQRALDEVTVTSKWYVDGKFNGAPGTVITQGQNRGETENTYIGNTKDSVDLTYGDGVLVTGKAVKQALDDVNAVATNVQADGTYLRVEDIDGEGLTPDGKMVLLNSGNLATGAAGITDDLTIGEGENLAPSAKLVTAGAVYDYAQPKVSTVAGTNSVQVGYKANSNANPTWTTLQAASNSAGSNNNYVTMNANSGVYTVNLASDMIGTGIGDVAYGSNKLTTGSAVYSMVLPEGLGGSSTITAANANGTDGDKKVPTVKNVYDFVTAYAGGTYQPKIETTDANQVMIGYRTATSDGQGGYEYADGWQQLSGDTYIAVVSDGTDATVGLKSTQMVSSKEDLLDSDNGAKLVKASAVRQLLGGNVLPPMPEACGSANNTGVHCALVTSWDSVAGAVKLEWTVMAAVTGA